MNTVKTLKKKNTQKKVISEKFKDLPTMTKVIFLETYVEFHLSDERIITIPLAWLTRLKNASNSDRNNYQIRGHFVFWDNLDEIIGVKNLLNGSVVPV